MNYIDKMHKWGRTWALVTCTMIFAFPFALAIIFNAWPDLGVFFKGLFGVAFTFWPVGIIEVLTYTPMLGVGGTYLSFVTGNLTSLKVPCALDAMEKAEVKADSDEGEVISTIAIATSSIMTIIVILIGVIMIFPLLRFIESFHQMNGGLGVVYLSRYFEIAILPVSIMILLFVFVPYLDSGMVGIMIPVSMLITLAYSRVLYNKERRANGEI